ncbi:SGNH/GDSL hydrolase family protein [Patulibacter minatonensis]|uniref:SGNH/GDSL hydrolase family protein n=1 Tax=Patulibacter minatonensis TaxID=298163 RepID=UPI000478CB26|nr:SGNH/GDSL hydrolase family protein [Patulibacter minatonensis]
MSGAPRWTSGPSRSLALVVLVVLGATLAVVGLALPRHEEHAPRIAPPALEVVSLGDSLSRGVQPLAAGGGLRTTDRGYAPRLAAALRARHGEVRLVEAGCPDADTDTLLRGGRCAPRAAVPYANDGPSTSQVTWAARRLRERGDAPTLVTLDVGGNDLLPCLNADRARLSRCLAAAEPGLLRRTRTITRRLKAAAGSRTVLVGATVYDPYVGLLRVGGAPRGAVLALHRTIRDRVNPRLSRVLRAEGWEVAELGRALGGNAPLTGKDPRAVRAACAYTWMCALNDVHLNDRGYARAARLFDRASRAAVDGALG